MRPTIATLCQTVAITVASMLGVGILGLPVSLHAAGLPPFILLLTVSLFAQLAIIVLIVELLQRDVFTHLPNKHPIPLEDTVLDTIADKPAPPSLYSLAHNFIPLRSLRIFFNFLVYFHFILILVAYGLAGPQAYIACIPPLSRIPFSVCSAAFVIVAAISVYLLTPALLPALSVATLVKGVLLVLLVVITLLRGLTIHRPTLSSWAFTKLVDPLLMGSFALNGTVHLMPVTFQLCTDSLPHDRGSIRALMDRQFFAAYQMAIMTGVTICYILNLLWCVAVVLVVPQSTSSMALEKGNPNFLSVPSNMTLDAANSQGEISTVPLMQVLEATHDKTNYVVALLVNFFIVVSITVSMVILSVGMIHYIKGSVTSSNSRSNSEGGVNASDEGQLFMRYFASYLMVLGLTLYNAKALFRVMEGLLTIVIGLEAAIFFVYMFVVGRADAVEAQDTTSIPFSVTPLHAKVLVGFSLMYYVAAVVIDSVVYLPSHLLS